jgi:hypothetical protein
LDTLRACLPKDDVFSLDVDDDISVVVDSVSVKALKDEEGDNIKRGEDGAPSAASPTFSPSP